MPMRRSGGGPLEGRMMGRGHGAGRGRENRRERSMRYELRSSRDLSKTCQKKETAKKTEEVAKTDLCRKVPENLQNEKNKENSRKSKEGKGYDSEATSDRNTTSARFNSETNDTSIEEKVIERDQKIESERNIETTKSSNRKKRSTKLEEWLTPTKTTKVTEKSNGDEIGRGEKNNSENTYEILTQMEVEENDTTTKQKAKNSGKYGNTEEKKYFWDTDGESVSSISCEENYMSGTKRMLEDDNFKEYSMAKTAKSDEAKIMDTTEETYKSDSDIEDVNDDVNNDEEEENTTNDGQGLEDEFDETMRELTLDTTEQVKQEMDDAGKYDEENSDTSREYERENIKTQEQIEQDEEQDKKDSEQHTERTNEYKETESSKENEIRDERVQVTATEVEKNVTFAEVEDPYATMARRGERMVEETVVKTTPVAIEFNIPKANKVFNARKSLLDLLNVLWEADNSLKVRSWEDTRTWGPSDKLPLEQKFVEKFKVHKTETRYGTSRVYVHVRLLTTEDVARLKWRPIVRDYIFNHNIWVREDKFQAQISSTPGYFVGIHPRATNKEDFKNVLISAMNDAEIDENKDVVKEWKNTPEGDKKIPEFTLHTAVRKWGQIRTEVISIECVKTQAKYMKYIVSTTVEQKLVDDCLFIPIGIHLMKSSEVLSNLLRQHNKFVADTETFDVFGIYPETLEKIMGKNNTTLLQEMENTGYFKKMERTPVTDTRGIWTMVVKKNQSGACKGSDGKITPELNDQTKV